MAKDDVEDNIHTETQDVTRVGIENGCDNDTDKEWWEVLLDKYDSDLKFLTVKVHHLDKNDTSDEA